MFTPKLTLAALTLAVGLAGCGEAPPPVVVVGPIGGSVAPEPESAPTGPTCDGPAPGESPLRRLTRTEYDNTIRDLVGDNRRLAEGTFPPDGTVMGYPVPVPMTATIAELYRDAAESIAVETL